MASQEFLVAVDVKGYFTLETNDLNDDLYVVGGSNVEKVFSVVSVKTDDAEAIHKFLNDNLPPTVFAALKDQFAES